jgi:glycosyltransferase involved in cell wall biosynthesis
MVLVGVVIPAHNEQRTIARLLDALRPLAGDADVAVVCNGCTDATADVARRAAPWVTVVEIEHRSKPAALRAGDQVVPTTPRLYLDADVVLTAADVHRLVAALSQPAVQAVAPTPRYDTEGASALVRSHYRIWTALESARTAISGTGAILVSATGRSRFGEWPDVIADDYFVDGLFAPGEKRRMPDVEVVVTLPRRFASCISRRARVHQGNRDVLAAGLRRADAQPGDRTVRLLGLMRERPALVADLPAHLAVVVSTRLLSAWRRRRGAAHTFFRDDSSR